MYDAKKLHTKKYQDQTFVVDALAGLERCAGESVTEMLDLVENEKLSPDSAQLALLTRVFPPFNDMMQQLRAADAEYAWQTASHFRELLRGPPNKPTKNRAGLLQVCMQVVNKQINYAKNKAAAQRANSWKIYP